jgi:hypothetical protein
VVWRYLDLHLRIGKPMAVGETMLDYAHIISSCPEKINLCLLAETSDHVGEIHMCLM